MQGSVCVCVCRSLAVGTQFSSWEAMLRDTEEEAKVQVHSTLHSLLPSLSPALF